MIHGHNKFYLLKHKFSFKVSADFTMCLRSISLHAIRKIYNLISRGLHAGYQIIPLYNDPLSLSLRNKLFFLYFIK